MHRRGDIKVKREACIRLRACIHRIPTIALITARPRYNSIQRDDSITFNYYLALFRWAGRAGRR